MEQQILWNLLGSPLARHTTAKMFSKVLELFEMFIIIIWNKHVKCLNLLVFVGLLLKKSLSKTYLLNNNHTSKLNWAFFFLIIFFISKIIYGVPIGTL